MLRILVNLGVMTAKGTRGHRKMWRGSRLRGLLKLRVPAVKTFRGGRKMQLGIGMIRRIGNRTVADVASVAWFNCMEWSAESMSQGTM